MIEATGPIPYGGYPEGAAQVRDLIREYLKSQVDEGSSMDTGGGCGGADLWVKFGGVEYVIHVTGGR